MTGALATVTAIRSLKEEELQVRSLQEFHARAASKQLWASRRPLQAQAIPNCVFDSLQNRIGNPAGGAGRKSLWV